MLRMRCTTDAAALSASELQSCGANLLQPTVNRYLCGQMMQQSNKYKGIDNKAKAHCPVRGNECANKCMKQAAKEKAGPSSAGRRGSKASSSSAHQPNAQACKAGRPRGRAQQKQPGQKQPGQKQPG
ncbi:TPA: hypothetical protein ACH3X3_011671 [Trebouxia sp. C0006]